MGDRLGIPGAVSTFFLTESTGYHANYYDFKREGIGKKKKKSDRGRVPARLFPRIVIVHFTEENDDGHGRGGGSIVTVISSFSIRSVSLQKGTNQPDNTDEPQWVAAWRRSTEYSTASET